MDLDYGMVSFHVSNVAFVAYCLACVGVAALSRFR